MTMTVPAKSLGSPQQPLVALSHTPMAGTASRGRCGRLNRFMAVDYESTRGG